MRYQKISDFSILRKLNNFKPTKSLNQPLITLKIILFHNTLSVIFLAVTKLPKSDFFPEH